MKNITISQDIIDNLISRARNETLLDRMADDEEDVNIFDFSGGNFDDAFNSGISAGRTELAREILDSLGIIYK